MVDFFSFTFYPFILSGEYIHLSSIEINSSLLFGSSCIALNSIDGDMNQFSRQVISEQGHIQVGKVDICSDSR